MVVSGLSDPETHRFPDGVEDPALGWQHT
eukprot:COSAG01_NODE_50683_length_361_cov_0.961832_1_plen_28_part_01